MQGGETMPKIKIYSTTTCPYCHMLKSYLKEKEGNSPTPTTFKKQTTPTNKPEVKSDSNAQNNNPSSSSNNGNNNITTVIVVTATPAPTNTLLPTATQAPIVAEDNSWKIQWCKDSIAIYEGYKQEAMNQARINGQNECVKRGYSPPDYGSCSGLIDQWVSDAAAPYDSQILQFKLDSGCWMLVD